MDAAEESDHALAVRSRQGDQRAFEQLIHRTARLVFTRLYLDTGNPHEAEDLTQEAFLIACRNIHKLVDPDGFRGWILSIAHTVHLDAIKHKSRKKRGTPTGVFEDQPDPGKGPVDQVSVIEEREKVLIALRTLPEDYQRPLALRYLAGADYQTISQQLGLTNGSLRGLLQRGLEMLREKMDAN